MQHNLHLPPHLQGFVRDQLVAGHFQSENDVICAALSLLQQQSKTSTNPTSHTSQAGKPTDAFSQKPRAADAVKHRSPRGILADLASHLDANELKEARSEMWSEHFSGRAE